MGPGGGALVVAGGRSGLGRRRFLVALRVEGGRREEAGDQEGAAPGRRAWRWSRPGIEREQGGAGSRSRRERNAADREQGGAALQGMVAGSATAGGRSRGRGGRGRRRRRGAGKLGECGMRALPGAAARYGNRGEHRSPFVRAWLP